MKIRCIICKIEEELLGEDLADIAKMVNKNPKAKTTDYLRHLNIIRGPICNNDKEHKYLFHDDFNVQMDNLLGEYQDVSNSGKSIEDIILKLEKLTGSRDIKLWF